jgi:hypothetical protein
MSPSGLGRHQIGVRWNTVSCSTSGAIEGMTCTADAPVPMIATRLPARSRLWSQRAVCITVPVKSSRPGMVGGCGFVSTPVAPTTKRADRRSPSAVSTFHRWFASSKVAATTLVSSRVRRRMSYLSMQCSA